MLFLFQVRPSNGISCECGTRWFAASHTTVESSVQSQRLASVECAGRPGVASAMTTQSSDMAGLVAHRKSVAAMCSFVIDGVSSSQRQRQVAHWVVRRAAECRCGRHTTGGSDFWQTQLLSLAIFGPALASRAVLPTRPSPHPRAPASHAALDCWARSPSRLLLLYPCSRSLTR